MFVGFLSLYAMVLSYDAYRVSKVMKMFTFLTAERAPTWKMVACLDSISKSNVSLGLRSRLDYLRRQIS